MELGSDFELDTLKLKRVDDNIFDFLKGYNTIYLDSGRSAIRLILDKIKGLVLLPSYICESVIDACGGTKNIRYYKVDANFNIDMDDFFAKLTQDIKVVYIMHYFGALQDKGCLSKIQELKNEYGFTIIEDTTHSIFTAPHTIGDYCVCSLRKWFAVPDGAVLYSKSDLSDMDADDLDEKNVYRRLQAMILKSAYINENVDCNRVYRDIFEKTEHELDLQQGIYRMSDISKGLLKCYSVGKMIKKRKTNYERLLKSMDIMGIRGVLKSHDIVPLAFPVVVKNRDELRAFLIKKQVYCAVHWPNVSEDILSLPLDHRYGREHMQYLVGCIKKYLESK